MVVPPKRILLQSGQHIRCRGLGAIDTHMRHCLLNESEFVIIDEVVILMLCVR